MTGRSNSAVADSARRILPVNYGPWVVDRALTAVYERTVRLGAVASSPIEPAILWDYGSDRSRGRHAHGFTFLADWLGAFPRLDVDSAALAALLHEMLQAWDERFGQHRESSPEMAFHDETTAQRLLGVVGALDRFTLTPQQREDLTEFAHRTASILAEPGFYGGVNNHGMFQDLALLTWSTLIAKSDDELGTHVWELATERLHTYFSTCFTPEGVHVENTPTYHVMVARYLPILDELFTRAETPHAKLYARLLPGAVNYAVHCITPEARYPPVSDTHTRRLDTPQNLETFRSGEFEYAATGGARGTRPAARTAVFPDSGYVLSRSAWGDSGATFIHFSCAYNADYHKHSDEQSIYLRSDGRSLLCEAGPYGYNWRDPFTRYAYSSSAHNSLVVGGTGLPRTEPSHQFSDSSSPLNELDVALAEDDRLDATGITRRYRGRVWQRRLRVVHGPAARNSLLTVTDTVRSAVGAEDLRFLWHVGAGLTVEMRTDGAEVFDGPVKVMEIEFHSDAEFTLELVEGSEEPSIQGWYFPNFGRREPAPVILVDAHATDLTLTTEVRLSSFVWSSWTSQNPANEHPDSLGGLEVDGRTISTWTSPGSDDQSVLFLSGYPDEAARDRLVAALLGSEYQVRYIPDIAALITEPPSPVRHAAEVSVEGETAFENVVRAAIEHIRSQARRGVRVRVATVGEGFAPGAVAALATGMPLISLDPQLPFPNDDSRVNQLKDRIAGLVAGLSDADVEILVSGEADEEVARSLHVLGSYVRTHAAIGRLLRADVEEAFSRVLLNALDVGNGTGIKYLAFYDRRAQEFILEVPDAAGAEVSVRVFRGKDEVLAMPYAAGAIHRVPYSGAIGPHRLRIHVRGPQFNERIAFTTTAVRVR